MSRFSMLSRMCETVMSYQFTWCLFGIAEMCSFQEEAVLAQQKKDMKPENRVQDNATGKNSLSNKSGMLSYDCWRMVETA